MEKETYQYRYQWSRRLAYVDIGKNWKGEGPCYLLSIFYGPTTVLEALPNILSFNPVNNLIILIFQLRSYMTFLRSHIW